MNKFDPQSQGSRLTNLLLDCNWSVVCVSVSAAGWLRMTQAASENSVDPVLNSARAGVEGQCVRVCMPADPSWLLF